MSAQLALEPGRLGARQMIPANLVELLVWLSEECAKRGVEFGGQAWPTGTVQITIKAEHPATIVDVLHRFLDGIGIDNAERNDL